MPADLSIEDGVGIHELTLTVVGAGVPSGLPLRKWVLATVEFLPAYCIKFLISWMESSGSIHCHCKRAWLGRWWSTTPLLPTWRLAPWYHAPHTIGTWCLTPLATVLYQLGLILSTLYQKLMISYRFRRNVMLLVRDIAVISISMSCMDYWCTIASYTSL